MQGLGHTKGASVRFGQSWGLVGRGGNPSWTGKRTEGKIVGVGFPAGHRPGWRWVVVHVEVG